MKTISIIKKIVFANLLTFTFSLATVSAQNDTMYVLKSGVVVGKFNVITQVDSVIFYQPPLPAANSFTDPRDGKDYQTINIGSQTWMAENLAYLPSVVGPGTGSETTPYYYVYGYNYTVVANAKANANFTTYGVLYNWPAAMNGAGSSTASPSGVQGVCPAGWHLPSDVEWTTLTTYLGGESIAGGKLKETGTAHWSSPNTGATNETGFTALPGGNRSIYGDFYHIGPYGGWWSATKDVTYYAWSRYMAYEDSSVHRSSGYQEDGFSVRCVRD